MAKIDTWIIHKTRTILVTDMPGPPADVIVIIDKADYDAKGPTVSNLGFDRDVFKGFDDETEARRYADTKASELGYAVRFSWYDFPDYDDEFDQED